MQLKDWRIAKGLNQAQVGELLGISHSQYSRLEAGRKRDIGLITAAQIVRITEGKVSFDDLLQLSE